MQVGMLYKITKMKSCEMRKLGNYTKYLLTLERIICYNEYIGVSLWTDPLLFI